jgi:outer membrane protein, heavy metal efflux system
MVVLGGALDAQPPAARNAPVPPISFSLADAASLARRQHPLLRAAGGRRQMVVGAARQESAFPNPVFEWRKENYGSPLPRDEFISTTMPVDLYGRRVALRAASGFTSSRALADSATTARQVEFDIARAYWRTALAAALRDAAVEQRHAVDTIARVESERAQQGAVPVGAALRARLEADRARLTEAGARAELERAHGDLARSLAMPFDSVPLPTDSVRVESGMTVPPLPTLLALARAHRADLHSAQLRVDEAAKRQLAERLGSLPALGVQVGSKRTSGFQTGTVQIGVALPFFDRNGGNRQRARGDALVAEGELRAAETAVTADVTSASRAYAMLLAEYDRAVGSEAGDSGLRGLELRGRAVAGIAATAYREGAIQLFEFLDAVRARADVRAAALRAAVDVKMARLDLMRAIGLPIDSPSLLSPP